MSDLINVKLNLVIDKLDEVRSAIRGKHSLVGIAFLLLLHYGCIKARTDEVKQTVEQRCVQVH
jgi:hypothetical protein